ncbi:hypothetical protein [Caloramator proteoclasticus]|nr:hypothetical protein [Caloramator proteoclasticus]
MAMKISVSFKENEKHIYDYLMTKLSPSIYLKELILQDMKKQKDEQKQSKVKINTFNSLDF